MECDCFGQLTKVPDTSAANARQGRDIQGIRWDRLNITREKYRLTRLEQYRNYENVPNSGEAAQVSFSPLKWIVACLEVVMCMGSLH